MDNLGEDFRNQLMEISNSPVAFSNASIWRRAAALLIDVLILNFIIFSPFQDLLTGFFSEAGLGALDAQIPGHIYASLLFMSLIALLYFTLLQYYQQQTIGMMVMKTYVLPKPGFWKSAIRNLFILPFFPFNLLWIIEPAYLFFKGRRVLEKFTNTNTVMINDG